MKHVSVITFLLILISAGILPACNDQSEASTTTDTSEKATLLVQQLVFDKLVGTWKSENGKNFERWTKNSDGTFQSVVFSINGSDTSWNEQAAIYPENGQWVFENTVKGQNDGKAARFVSSILTETTVQFSNPAHDFPTDVNYTVPSINIVNAFIIGPNSKGGRDTIPFNYTRAE